MLGGMKRPRTPEEYFALVENAIFEVQDLRHALEYETDSMAPAASFVDDLERQLKNMRQSMIDGSYEFGRGRENLPFMSIVEQEAGSVLPFRSLLRLLNETHNKGLRIGDEA